MILEALLLATLAVATPSPGEEEPAAVSNAAETQPTPAAPPTAEPAPVAAPAAPSEAPPAQAHPASPEAPPSNPQREPEPCRSTTGATRATGCSATPDAPPDPSQPSSSREASTREPPDTGLVGWMDARHAQMESGLTALVYRADAFFGDPTHLQFSPPAFSARLRGGVRFGQDRTFSDQTSVLADVRLPSLNRALSRASLFLTGGNDEEQTQSGTEQDLVPRRFGSFGTSRGALELRYDLLRGYRSLVDVGSGVRFTYPPAPYARIRGAHAAELGLGLVGHVNQTGFWERNVGFGESTRLDVERVVAPRTITRAWGIATIHERSRGVEWAAELGVAQGLGTHTGMYAAGALQGASRPNQVDLYRLFTRFRRDLHRAWLFAEAEPEISWPRRPGGVREGVVAITLRLEVQLAAVKP